MLPSELEKLVKKIVSQKCERQDIELKCAEKGTPEKLYDTLSSFSNQPGGGVIIFGIDEKSNYKITGVYDAQDLQNKITNQALQMEPVVRPLFTVANIDDKIVVSAEIQECYIFDKPCFYKGAGRLRGSYIRVGDADLRMTEYEIYSYEAFRRKIRDELREVDHVSKDPFDEDKIMEYLIKIKKTKPNLSNQNRENILKLQGIITENNIPTVAGIMLFGKYPQASFPQLSITAMLVNGTEIGTVGENEYRFIDNQRIEGTIPQMLEEALVFINRNIKKATIINSEGKRVDRTEYPLLAIRELLVNSLIHRDYSIFTEDSPIRIVIYRNRIEIENPGGIYGRLTVDELGLRPADTRNPFIAGAMEILEETENRFSGIPTVRNEMKKAGLEPPVFENVRGTFKVILYNKENLAEKDSRYKEYSCGKDRKEKILDFCIEPRSRGEILDYLDIETPSYLFRKYLNPLLSEGKLLMTLPQTPKSKNQKYYTNRIYQSEKES